MKKAYALVTGIIFASFMLLIPFTGAFADSDPGIAGQVFNSAFSWYTGFPLVDSSGYLDLNDWTITYRSNGVDSTLNAGSGDVIYLYQPGDFIEYSFQQYDLLSSYITPLWFLQFGQNPAYSSGGLTDLKYTLYQSYTSSVSSYTYIRPFTYDNRMIDWTHVMFTYPGTGITKIRIEFDGTPAIWNCIYMKFSGFRTATDAITQADLYQLQAQITTSLNVARLADIVQLDSTDIDLSTLEATTASILQKLADVPDIIQYIDQIETIDSNILSAINTFYNFYVDLYKQTYRDINSGFIEANDSVYTISSSSERINTSEAYISLTSTKLDPITIIRIYFGGYNTTVSIDEFDFYITNSNLYRFDPVYYYFISGNYFYIVTDNTNILMGTLGTSQPVYNIYIKTFDNKKFSLYNKLQPSTFGISDLSVNTNIGFFNAVILYLKNLVYGSTDVPSSIQDTTDTVTEQVTDIVDFEDNYNQSLETSASQIDVSSYEIQQTSGMAFMRTYTELNFDRMQNFRILFLTPLILALAAFFLRRKT